MALSDSGGAESWDPKSSFDVMLPPMVDCFRDYRWVRLRLTRFSCGRPPNIRVAAGGPGTRGRRDASFELAGRLLNLRPLGPQPEDATAISVPTRPMRPSRPRFGTHGTHRTMRPVPKLVPRATFGAHCLHGSRVTLTLVPGARTFAALGLCFFTLPESAVAPSSLLIVLSLQSAALDRDD